MVCCRAVWWARYFADVLPCLWPPPSISVPAVRQIKHAPYHFDKRPILAFCDPVLLRTVAGGVVRFNSFALVEILQISAAVVNRSLRLTMATVAFPFIMRQPFALNVTVACFSISAATDIRFRERVGV
uniref:Putative secreted protein n=1 Tax=Anopheles triannulatus TaxID=58253 RepID=A0A2M4B540_9DIPT